MKVWTISMSKPLKLKTYTDKELKALIPALGTFIRPLLYKNRYIASCNHYSNDCSFCPFAYESDLCSSVYSSYSKNIKDNIDFDIKFFPDNFIENHPEYLI